MRGGYRNIFYATGLPRWMRFGYSPCWVGRGICGWLPTQPYLRTWMWPTLQAQWQGMPAGIPALTEQQELSVLESQAAILEQQLEQIKKRLEELKK
jgi:hypothetical protein